MKRLVSALMVFAALAWMAACGGGSSSSSSSSTVSITISPTTASVATGQTTQFTATVTNTTNTAVTWQVNSVTGGNTTVGTISTTGLYTAPSTAPNPNTATVSAISQADTIQSASAVVTITATTPAATIAVSPSVTTVPGGGQQTFTATVNGQNINVTWNVSCRSQSPGGCGSISPAGVYTAPASPPPGAIVNLTAAATDGSALAAGAVITVQFSNGSLNGQYAFSFSGRGAGALFSAAGSISLDGKGNVTGGVEDINSNGPSTINITGGSYNIGTDGRGGAVVQTQNGSEAWQFAVVNNAHAVAIRFDTGSVTAGGTMDLQDPTQFNVAAIQGNYAFHLAGLNASPGAAVAIAGALSADGTGAINQGLLDVNNAGSSATALTLTGAYSAPSNSGRGTLTISSSFASQSFAYYIVDGTRLKLVQTDLAQMVHGELVKQPAGPFTNASFRGGFAFTFAGASGPSVLGLGGIFVLDGGGNVNSGTADINSNGNSQSGLSLTGTYNVSDAATGRSTATLNLGGTTLQYVFYPQMGGALNFLEVDAVNVAGGAALAQAGSTFTGASLQGNYALSLTGTDLTSFPGEEDIAGQLIPNGGSALTGTLDINANGVTSRTTPLQGSYLVTSTAGRGTATLQTTSNTFASANLNLYILDSGTVLFLESDSNRVLTGIMQKQY